MDFLDNCSIQVSFDTVRNLLDQKQFPLDENEMAYLERSISFLDDVTKSLDSIDSPVSEKKVYYFTPKLRDIIGIQISKPEITKKDLSKSKVYFNKIKSQLEMMMVDPRKIYSSPKETEKLKDVILRIMNVYIEKPYNIEKDFTLSGDIRLSEL